MFTALRVAMMLAVITNQTGAQAPPAGQTFTLSGNLLRGYHTLQANLLAAAEKMPDADYSFRPTPEIRPFGQLVAHVALSQFGSCAALKGEPDPKHDEKEDAARSKADEIALLKASTDYCDPILQTLSDQTLTEMFKAGPNTVAKGLVLTSTNSHGNEMYGTMAVYLRLKGIVPPTTEKQNAAKKDGKE
jgi:uncharacterized damage-inducible protein DinB